MTGTTKRIFKQIYDQTAESTDNNVAAGGSKPRKFFCASFVAYLLQASEADAAWRQMKENNPELEKTLPNLSDPISVIKKSHPFLWKAPNVCTTVRLVGFGKDGIHSGWATS